MPAPPHAAAPAAPAPAAPSAPPAPAPAAPAAPSGTGLGSAAARALFTPRAGVRDLALWGSSSMSSTRGDESTPLPIRIHQHLVLATSPGTVHPHGVGATWSQHAVLMRGLDTPVAAPQGAPDPATGAVVVSLDSGLPPRGPIEFPARIGDVPGTLGKAEGAWLFTPEDPAAAVREGTLVSALAERVAGARQVLWMGKNNITQVDQVLEDTHRMWEATATPEEDTLVLGQWATPNDPVASATGDALAQVNAAQAERYGAHFVDLQSLFTSEEGLGCAPLAPLRLFEQGSTQDAIAQGVAPPLLVARDSIHLNGWGNLAVGWALIRRMRVLGWL